MRSLIRWLRSVQSRVHGSLVDINCEMATELSSRAYFPVSDELIARQRAARARLPENHVKADRA